MQKSIYKSMQLRVLLFLIILSSATIVQSQERYNSILFKNIQIERDIKYGAAKTQGGARQNLIMDIYSPENDTVKNRPLVIFAHGGYYLMGDKLGFEEECKFLAQSGYVAVSINYRLIDVEQTDEVAKHAVIDGVHDMKAAVRFFTKDTKGKNKYNIDPDNIFIGGYSAGAVTSLHYAYATKTEDIIEMGGEALLEYVLKNGGIEGTCGNPGNSSKIKGVINIAGSLHSAKLIDADEPILFSIQGTDDQIVPFMSGTTGDTEVITEGAGLIHAQAETIGLINQLIAIPKDGHLARYSCGTCNTQMRTFLFNNFRN